MCVGGGSKVFTRKGVSSCGVTTVVFWGEGQLELGQDFCTGWVGGAGCTVLLFRGGVKSFYVRSAWGEIIFRSL